MLDLSLPILSTPGAFLIFELARYVEKSQDGSATPIFVPPSAALLFWFICNSSSSLRNLCLSFGSYVEVIVFDLGCWLNARIRLLVLVRISSTAFNQRIDRVLLFVADLINLVKYDLYCFNLQIFYERAQNRGWRFYQPPREPKSAFFELIFDISILKCSYSLIL